MRSAQSGSAAIPGNWGVHHPPPPVRARVKIHVSSVYSGDSMEEIARQQNLSQVNDSAVARKHSELLCLFTPRTVLPAFHQSKRTLPITFSDAACRCKSSQTNRIAGKPTEQTDGRWTSLWPNKCYSVPRPALASGSRRPRGTATGQPTRRCRRPSHHRR